MADAKPTTRFRFWLWLICALGVTAPAAEQQLHALQLEAVKDLMLPVSRFQQRLIVFAVDVSQERVREYQEYRHR
jgi:uncharacterized lipoprotein YmbA